MVIVRPLKLRNLLCPAVFRGQMVTIALARPRRLLENRLPANCPTFLTLKLFHNEQMPEDYAVAGFVDAPDDDSSASSQPDVELIKV